MINVQISSPFPNYVIGENMKTYTYICRYLLHIYIYIYMVNSQLSSPLPWGGVKQDDGIITVILYDSPIVRRGVKQDDGNHTVILFDSPQGQGGPQLGIYHMYIYDIYQLSYIQYIYIVYKIYTLFDLAPPKQNFWLRQWAQTLSSIVQKVFHSPALFINTVGNQPVIGCC